MPIRNATEHEIRPIAYALYEKRGGTHGFDASDWLDAEQLVFFFKNYEMLAFYPLVSDKKTYLGDGANKVCRFCGKTTPEVSFSNIAHALPELIGNKSIIAYYECDPCNSLFARAVEDHLGKLLAATSPLTQIRSKGGISSFKTRAGKSRIDVRNGVIQVENYASDNMVTLNPEAKTMVVDSETQPLIPMAVFKCFAKMALSIMPEADVIDYFHTINWIRNEDHSVDAQHFKSLSCYATFMPGPMPQGFGWTLLLKRKEDDAELPSMIFVVATMNQSFQIMLPCSHKDNHLVGINAKIPPYPSFSGFDYDYGTPKRAALALGSPDRRRIPFSVSTTCDTMVKH